MSGKFFAGLKVPRFEPKSASFRQLLYYCSALDNFCVPNVSKITRVCSTNIASMISSRLGRLFGRFRVH